MERDLRTYEIEDFLMDESFVGWVNTGEDPERIWDNFASNYPDRAAVFEQSKHLALALRGRPKLPGGARKQAVWRGIERRINTQSRFGVIKPYLAVAASLALLYFIGTVFSAKPTVHTTGISETKSFILPDGSRVEMNAQTVVEYRANAFDKKRKVYLDGEAFFEVSKGKDFIIETGLGSVKVLGTSFNVFTRGEDMSVQCFTGEVSVSFKGVGGKIVLLPGQRVSNTENPKAENFDHASKKNWRQGYFYFDKMPLNKVLDELARQYGLEIVANADVKSQIYSGYFQKGNLEAAVESICLPLQLEAELSNGVLVLTRKHE